MVGDESAKIKEAKWMLHDTYAPGVSSDRTVTRSQTPFLRIKNTTSILELFADSHRHQPPGMPHLMEVMKGEYGSIPRTIITRSAGKYIGIDEKLCAKLIPFKTYESEKMGREFETLTDEELENLKNEELERKKMEELERLKNEELERKKMEELERLKSEELERKKVEELERRKVEELERLKNEELERLKNEELERLKNEELERKKNEELERLKNEELDRKRNEELERLRTEENLKDEREESEDLNVTDAENEAEQKDSKEMDG